MQREKFAIRNIAIKQLATQGNKKLAKAVRDKVMSLQRMLSVKHMRQR